MKLQRIGLGGGCYWCTEAVFQNLRGVDNVAQGFIYSKPPHDSLAEAVLVDFDPLQIGLADLIEVHLRTHASTSSHSLRKKYRSAIYATNLKQQQEAARVLQHLQDDFDNQLITRILPFAGFQYSDERYHNYYINNHGNQFCRRYIDPKLEMLRREYAHQTQDKCSASG